jgi:hypothetical protein
LGPVVTAEPAPALPEELEPEELEEEPPDFPPEFAPALAAALTLDVTLPPGGWVAMPPSMGANPRAIVKIQRARSIVLSVLTVCTQLRRAQNTPVIFAHKNPRQPAPHARWQGPTSPKTSIEQRRLDLCERNTIPRE